MKNSNSRVATENLIINFREPVLNFMETCQQHIEDTNLFIQANSGWYVGAPTADNNIHRLRKRVKNICQHIIHIK